MLFVGEKKDKLLGTVCAVVKVLQKKGTGIVDLNRLTVSLICSEQKEKVRLGLFSYISDSTYPMEMI